MRTRNFLRTVAILSLLNAVTPLASAQPDTTVIQQFQRAADTYAFRHRQIDRRGTPLEARAEGELFTPQLAAAFRSRLRTAALRGCALPVPDGVSFAVPRVNESSSGTIPLPDCAKAALPSLPPELEYRVAGAALVLADAHRHMVVDVMHGMF